MNQCSVPESNDDSNKEGPWRSYRRMRGLDGQVGPVGQDFCHVTESSICTDRDLYYRTIKPAKDAELNDTTIVDFGPSATVL